MKNIDFKKIIPIVSAIIIFVALTYTYLSPLLKGKVLYQSDMASVYGMAKETADFRDQYHEEPLWTNSMFGGMPTYLISIRSPASLIVHVRSLMAFGMPYTSMILFNYMLGFFILLMVLRVNPWLSIVGAISFAFCSYTFILLDAGHITKAFAIGYMAPVFASVILVCRKKYLLGGSLLALFMSLELYSSHVQITYYLVMFLVIYVAFRFVEYFKLKEYKTIGSILSVFVIAAILSFGCNFFNLMNTYDYAQHSIRGKSELKENISAQSNKTSGLDRDYVVQWSMGKAETMSLMIPGFKGRSSAKQIGENKNALKSVDPQMKEGVASMQQYWGDQPFTSANYSGAIVVFLFVFGLFIIKGRVKWVVLIAVILFSMLSWGKNFMFLTDFCLDILPGYNKFRTVSMMLVVVEFALPLLAILAIDKIYKNPSFINEKIQLKLINKEVSVQNLFFISFSLTGGLSLLYYLVPSLTNFTGAADERIFQQIAQSNGEQIAQVFMDNVEKSRIALFKADAIRSFFFILIGASVIWLYFKSKIKKNTLVLLIGVLILTDLWLVDKSFLNDKNFVTKNEFKDPFPETPADKYILEDKDPSYRVLNISVSTFNDASTSYRHKSVGGYHAAKLRRYQDMIDYYIRNETQNVMNTLRSKPAESAMNLTLSNQSVLNMMNTRYVIYNPSTAPIVNIHAYGNAWFVNDLKFVQTPDDEIAKLGEVNLRNTAILNENSKGEFMNFEFSKDETGSIILNDYKPNHLTYDFNSLTNQFTVFSEIYYKDGWNAYIDGEVAPHYSVNYVLRGLEIPKGKHKIEFKFEPKSYATRQNITLTSSLLLFCSVGVGLFLTFKRKRNE